MNKEQRQAAAARRADVPRGLAVARSIRDDASAANADRLRAVEVIAMLTATHDNPPQTIYLANVDQLFLRAE